MTDIYIAIIYVVILAMGFKSPFIFSLGFVWVDVFAPQLQSSVLTGIPVSLIVGILAFVGYMISDRRDPPKLTLITVLIITMAGWITLTSTWGVAPPQSVWGKWDWAFKVLIFSAFLPFVFRTRIQIEAFYQVLVFAASVHFVSGGLKTLAGGGGYGSALSVIRGNNTGIYEGSTMAAVAIMIIPILFSLCRHTLLMPSKRIVRSVVYYGYGACCGLTAMGTFARTALAGFVVLGIIGWLQSRRKLIFLLACALAASGAIYLGSERWQSRMQTTVEYENEDSAYGRVLVWKWTLNFAFEHPLGGGFNSYLVMQYSDDKGKQVVAKAFHNVYMEVLGEHGWVGLGIFVLLIITSIRYLYFVAYRIPNQQQFEWCRDLAKATLTSLFVLMACGCFIGIAFQYPFWYLFGAAVCLKEYVRRVSQLVPIRTRETWIAPPLTAESGNLGRNVS